jgi:hypothetical protein
LSFSFGRIWTFWVALRESSYGDTEISGVVGVDMFD